MSSSLGSEACSKTICEEQNPLNVENNIDLEIPSYCRFNVEQDKGYSCSKELNRAALFNIFQWRMPSQYQSELREEMNRVRMQTGAYMKASERHLNPRTKVLCCCCGYKVTRLYVHFLSEKEREKVELLLEGRLYRTSNIKPSSQQSNVDDKNSCYLRLACCKKWPNDLRSKKVPVTAISNGWNFSDEIPVLLSRLSRHERLQISLRLPCVHTWRLQGGFGQHDTKGAPVSFANPVANLARTLPWKPTAVFAPLLENVQKVNIRVSFVRSALEWLKKRNGLYSNVEIYQAAIQEVEDIEDAHYYVSEMSLENSSANALPSSEEMDNAEKKEAQCGTQGPLDGEALCFLESSSINGIEDLGDTARCRELIQHMVKPFTYRRNDMSPSYDAAKHLETCFPVYFPYGRGGPETLRRPATLAFWCKPALSVQCSPFKKDLDFIFFVNAVLRRKPLSELALNAPLRDRAVDALKEVRALLNNKEDAITVKKRVDYLIRSGAVNASFKSLRGSAAFWATLKHTSWAYLDFFGPCQLFLTMSVADVLDPFVFMEIEEKLTYRAARQLSTQQRAQLLAENPVAATTIFYRRVEALFDHFLFGNTRPFQDIVAYLGRVEQQERKSPHLHLLFWLSSKAPVKPETMQKMERPLLASLSSSVRL